jgi:hypothetical protein
MDWNWFFSTFAQCGAAIIGLIGAFIISKLIDITAKIYTSGNDLPNLIFASKALTEALDTISINDYNRSSIQCSNLFDECKLGTFDNKGEFELVERLKNCIPLYVKDPQIYKLFCAKYNSIVIFKNDPPEQIAIKLDNRMKKPPNIASRFPSMETTELKMKELNEKVNHQISLVTLTKINLKSYLANLNFIRNIIIILYIAFFTIIIYPLHFMPLKVNINPIIDFKIQTFIHNLCSLSGILLTSFSIIISVIIFFFFRNIRDQKKIVNRNIGVCIRLAEKKNYSIHLT